MITLALEGAADYSAYIHVSIHTYIYMHLFIHIQYIYVHTHTNMYIHMYTYVHNKITMALEGTGDFNIHINILNME
jgi:hypothetical protein